jgi:hypothetical protein
MTTADTQTFAPQYDWVYGATGETTPHMTLFLPLAMNNPCYFHALLVFCRLFQIEKQGGNPQDDKVIAHHRGRAFQYLQETVTDVENDAMVVAVVASISTDVRWIFIVRLLWLTTCSGFWVTLLLSRRILRDSKRF